MSEPDDGYEDWLREGREKAGDSAVPDYPLLAHLMDLQAFVRNPELVGPRLIEWWHRAQQAGFGPWLETVVQEALDAQGVIPDDPRVVRSREALAAHREGRPVSLNHATGEWTIGEAGAVAGHVCPTCGSFTPIGDLTPESPCPWCHGSGRKALTDDELDRAEPGPWSMATEPCVQCHGIRVTGWTDAAGEWHASVPRASRGERPYCADCGNGVEVCDCPDGPLAGAAAEADRLRGTEEEAE